jgi:hypothetical protein
VNSVNVMFTVLEVQVVDLEQLSATKKEETKKSKRPPKRGLLVQQSELEFTQASTGAVKITGNPGYVPARVSYQFVSLTVLVFKCRCCYL